MACPALERRVRPHLLGTLARASDSDERISWLLWSQKRFCSNQRETARMSDPDKRREDEALRRMPNTPSRPHKPTGLTPLKSKKPKAE
jgi:hypothetical protein